MYAARSAANQMQHSPASTDGGSSQSEFLITIVVIVRLAPFQCVALLAADNLRSGLSSARLVASYTLRL